MRGFKLIAVLIIFNLAVVVTSNVWAGPFAAETYPQFLFKSITDWHTWVSWGTIIGAFGLASAVLGMSIPIGAVVFAAIFGVSTLPFNAVLSNFVSVWPALGFLHNFLIFPLYLVFTFTFIQLSSTPAGGGLED